MPGKPPLPRTMTSTQSLLSTVILVLRFLVKEKELQKNRDIRKQSWKKE